jgi:flavocytochrome c
MTAAEVAASMGARVTLLEQGRALGGSALRAQGLSAAGTPVQAEAGIDFSTEDLERDILEFGMNRSIPEMASLVARESGEAARYLEDLGVQVEVPDPQGAPWYHQSREGVTGPEVVKALQNSLDRWRVDIRLENRVTELLMGKEGKMVGARVAQPGGKEFLVKCRALILATGGFGGNTDMISRFANQWEGIGVNLSQAQGDGLRLAMASGADITHMQYIQVYPAVTQDGIPVMKAVENGAILVNREGLRFADETGDPQALARAIMDQPGSRAFLLGDLQVMRLGPPALRSDGLIEEDDLEAVSQRLKVPWSALGSTVERYNASVGDDEFGREQGSPVDEAPYFALEVRPAVWATLGGLKINQGAQVLRDGKPFGGFFAAGEVVGGVFGAGERGSGHLTAAIVLGRVAARSAVEVARREAKPAWGRR